MLDTLKKKISELQNGQTTPTPTNTPYTPKQWSPAASRDTGRRFTFTLPSTAPTKMTAQRVKQWSPVQVEEEEPWYRGSQPTFAETMARIQKLYGNNPQQAEVMYTSVMRLTADPTAPVYSPYLQATNPAVANLAALGIDVSTGVDADWIERNRSLMSGYRLGTSGTPLAPASNSTPANDAGYWYYKVTEAEETTQKAETEWAALQEELTYWATRSDRNYSDEEILARIDWSNYPTLTRMDEGRQQGVPLMLNRPIGYSTDSMYGTLWAARNGGGSGNPLNDSLSYYSGQGNAWQADEDITARLDPTSDRYCPYALGSTLDDEALYFGVSSFDEDWLAANRGLIASDDATARKMYARVYDAEQLTQKAEAEWAALQEQVARLQQYGADPDRIMQVIDWSDYPTLARMDESLQTGELLGLTRSVPYNRRDFVRGMERYAITHDTSVSDYVQELQRLFDLPYTLITGESGLSVSEILEHAADPDETDSGTERKDDDEEGDEPEPGSIASRLSGAPMVASAGRPGPTAQFDLTASDGRTGPGGLTESVNSFDAPPVTYATRASAATASPEMAVSAVRAQGDRDEKAFRSVRARKHVSSTALAIDSSAAKRLGAAGIEIAQLGSDAEKLAWRTGPDIVPAVVSLRRSTGKGSAWIGLGQYFSHKTTEQNTLLTSNPQPFMNAYAKQLERDRLQRRVTAAEAALAEMSEGAPRPELVLNAIVTDPGYMAAQDELREAAQAELREAQKALEAFDASQEYQDAMETLAQYGAAPSQVALRTKLSDWAGVPFSDVSVLPVLQAAVACDGYVAPDPTGWSEFELYEMSGVAYEEVAAYAHQCDLVYTSEIEAIDYTVGVLELLYPAGASDVDVSGYLTGLERRREYLVGQREDIKWFLLREEDYFDVRYHSIISPHDTPFPSYRKLTYAAAGGFYKSGSYGTGDAVVPELSIDVSEANSTTYGEDFMVKYLYHTQRDDEAEAYKAYMARRIPYRVQARQADIAQAYARAHPFIGAAQARLNKMVGAIAATGYIASTKLTGGELDPFSVWYDLSESGENLDAGARERLVGDAGGEDSIPGKITGLVFDVASTLGDSAANAAVFGPVGIVTMGLQAGVTMTQNAKLRGATDTQALQLGTAAFLAESVTELLFQYNFAKAVQAGKVGNWLQFAKLAGLDATIEGAGEGVSQIITDAADRIIMDEQSSFSRAFRAYQDAGHSDSEAERRAIRDSVAEVAYSAVLGFFASAGSHAGGFTVGKAAQTLDSLRYTNTSDVASRAMILAEAMSANGLAVNTTAVAAALAAPTAEATPASSAQEGHTMPTPAVVQDEAAPSTAEEAPAAESTDSTAAQEGHRMLTPATVPDDAAPAAENTTSTKEASTAQDGHRMLTSLDPDSMAAEDAVLVADFVVNLAGSPVNAVQLAFDLLLAADAANISMDRLSKALSYAQISSLLGMNSSVAVQAITDLATPGAEITQADVTSFVETAEAELAEAPIMLETAMAVRTDMQVARRVQQKVADGALDGLQSGRVAIDKASVQVDLAKHDLQVAQQQLQASQDNLSTLSEQHLADPANQMTRGAFQQAIKDLEGDTIVVQQMKQALAQRTADLQRAKETQENHIEQELYRLRTEAVAELAQEEEAAMAAQAEAEAAEAARVAEEAAMAEEQRQLDNVTAVEVEAFLAEMEKKYPGLTDEQRGQLREQYANRLSGQQDTTPATPDRSGVPQSTLGLMSRLSRLYGVRFKVTDGVLDGLQYRGAYQSDGTILVSRNATQDEVLRRTLIHELTHRAETGDAYGAFAQELLGIVYGDNMQQLQADLDTTAARYRSTLGTGYKDSIAFSELVAAKAEDILGNADVINRLAAEKPSIAARIWQTLKDFVKRIVGVKSSEADRIRKAEELYRKALEQAREKASQQRSGMEGHHPMTTQFSITQLADSLGLKVDEITVGDETLPYRLVDRNGNPVTKITAEDIDKTYLGRLIRVAETARTITSETATAQRELFAELATLVATCQDGAMIWEMVGAEFFSAVKNNSDKQYGKTVDFGTVCVKTKALVDVLSETMVRLGRGLTRDEVLKAYAETAKADLSVPCAPCYVFSRWIGVPSLLKNMKAYQQRFEGWTAEQVTSYIDSAIRKYSSPNGKGSASSQINKKKASIEKKLATATDKLKKLYEASRNRELTTKQQAALDKQRRLADSLDSQLAEIDAYNWVTQVLCSFHTENGAVIVDRDANGNVVLNPEYKAVPDDVLFDLRTGAKFATEYPWAWRYRTTRGAGMGKAILPYSGFTLGDVIYSTQRRTAAEENIFLSDEADVDSLLRKLQNRVKTMRAQNLIGGFRWQSTSDFRPEWGLDYIMTMLEMQACGAKGQLYTKIIEAAEMFATAGIETNLSLIAKGKGYHLDENGRPVIGLEDLSSVSGIDAAAAFELIKRHDNAQVILVGLSPEHIRAAMADSRIGFIIPWHASGSSDQIQLVLLYAIGESPSDAVDFTDVQNDSPLKNRTVLQKQTADIRTRLLTGKLLKDGVLITTEAELEIINGNEFLKSLYERFYLDSSATETYHAWLSSEQASGIFPYEYWDTSLGLEDADENGRRFVRYCESLGLQPRFSEFQNDPGYWKLLIDRRMYNRDGTYHHPQTVDVTKIKTSDIPLSVSAVRYDNDAAVEQAVLNTIDRVTGRLPSPDFAANQVITGSVSDFVRGQVAQMRETAQEGAQFALTDTSGNEVVLTEEQLTENNTYVANMDPVATLEGNPMSKDVIDDFFEAGTAYFKSIGGKAVNPILGEVALDATGIRHLINRKLTWRKAATLRAVKPAIEQGRILYVDNNHVGKPIDTAIIAASITLDGEAYYIGAVVSQNQYDKSNTYELHDAVLVQKKTEAITPTKTPSAGDNQLRGRDSAPPIAIILSELAEYNRQFAQDFGGTKFADPAPLLPSPEILDAEMAAFHDRMSGPPSTPDNTDPGPESFNNPGERQFNTRNAQKSQAIPAWLKRELWADRWYEKDTNRAQAERAWNRIASEGYEAARERLLNKTDWGTDENVEALIMMHMALRSVEDGGMGDPAFAMEVSLRYGQEGTKQGQALQARQLFQKMTPIGMRVWATSSAETALQTYLDGHKPVARLVDGVSDKLAGRLQNLDRSDRLKATGEIVIDPDRVSRWGVPLNEAQEELIDHYDLRKVARPGLHYNRATIKQRMLEAILATPDPLAPTGLGRNLVQRLELMQRGAPVALETDLVYICDQLEEYAANKQDGTGNILNREADVALARAHEAYANITPKSGAAKLRTLRYVNMLLRGASAARNVIGNITQTTANTAAHVFEVGLDAGIGLLTHERTSAFLSPKEHIEGFKAFVSGIVEQARDVFADRVNTQMTADRYNLTDNRGRVFQNPVLEAAKELEVFLMSVGDRPFFKKAYVNSLSEQRRVCQLNGTEFDFEIANERALQDAMYATFNEDSAVRRALQSFKARGGALGLAVDFLMPFTGVPTNILKRSYQYSPVALTATALKHAGRALQGKNFDQRSFVREVSRGLTGTGILVIGAVMASAGIIKLGTREDDDDREYQLHTAMGEQYAATLLLGDTHINLSAFNPAAMAMLWGAHIAAGLDELSADAGFGEYTGMFLSSLCKGGDLLFDASYMTSLSDFLSSPDGSFSTAHAASVLANSTVGQLTPGILSDLASSLDPFVRDTRDKDIIMGVVKSAMNRIPGLRQMLPAKVDVAGRRFANTDFGGLAFVDPFNRTTQDNNPVLVELDRLHTVLGTSSHMPSDALSGTRDKLTGVSAPVTGTAKERYKVRYGELWLNGGTTYDAEGNQVQLMGVSELIASDWYRKMTDAEKAEAIAGVIAAAKAGAIYETGEALGHTPKTSSSMPSTSAIKGVPLQLVGRYPELDRLFDATGDGTFLPRGIGRVFDRTISETKHHYQLDDKAYEVLWDLYLTELDGRMAKIDFSGDPEDVAEAVAKAYSAAAADAKDDFVTLFPDGRVK